MFQKGCFLHLAEFPTADKSNEFFKKMETVKVCIFMDRVSGGAVLSLPLKSVPLVQITVFTISYLLLHFH